MAVQHASSARFLERLQEAESRAAAAAAFYRFRRSGREAYERAHWAQTERRRGGAGSSTDGTVFNWRILRHPRNAGGEACRVGQLRVGVSYGGGRGSGGTGRSRGARCFSCVPQELDGAHYCLSPTRRETVEFSLSARPDLGAS